jgi:2-succinyl-6-hydroxy-2,4-cyclohexadiene-1-carboxylate synthase
MTMMRVDVAGQALEVAVTGAGPALLLLHGFTGTADTWRVVVDALAGQRRAIAPDLLGHGRSAAPGDPARYTLARQADGLVRLLGSLDARPADVVGYSMGARLALRLVVDHPAMVRSLVLESPSAGILDADERARRRAADERLAERLEATGLEAFVDAWESQPLFASQARLPAEARGRLRAERRAHDPHGLAASLRGAGQGAMAPLQKRLGEIACPVLVIAGALDPLGQARARGIAAAIPQARFELVEGAGHAPHLERPDVVSHLLGQFLTADQPIATH